MDVANILKEARKRKKVTQSEVANILGITAGAYSKIETGVNALDIQHLAPICDFLDIDVWELIETYHVCTEVVEEDNIKEVSLSMDAIHSVSNEEAMNLLGQHINVLVIGSSFSSQKYVIPKLFEYDGSYMVLDEMGILKKSTESKFKEQGYDIKVLDLFTLKFLELYPEWFREKQKMNCNGYEILKDNISCLFEKPTIIYIIPDSFDYKKNELALSYILTILNELKTRITQKNKMTILLDLNTGVIPDGASELLNLLERKDEVSTDISLSIIVDDIEMLQIKWKEYWQQLIDKFSALYCMGNLHFYGTRQFLIEYIGENTLENNTRKKIEEHELFCMIKKDGLLVQKGKKLKHVII